MPTILPGRTAAILALCPAARPLCPKCGNVLGGVYVSYGATFVTCSRRGGGPGGGRCGQQAFIVAATAGLCIVVKAARAQFERFAASGLEPLEIARHLGALVEISERSEQTRVLPGPAAGGGRRPAKVS